MANFDFTSYGQAAGLGSGIDDTLSTYLTTLEESTPSLSKQKADRLAQRAADKSTKLGFDNLAQIGFEDPTSNVFSSESLRPIDADTYRIAGREGSTRTLGVDTYETPKDAQWLLDPNNAARIEKQRQRLSAEIGRPASMQDVFTAGIKQKEEVEALSNAPLPSLLEEIYLKNANTHVLADGTTPVNYGRDLGGLRKLGGMATRLSDGALVDGRTEVANTNLKQAAEDVLRYKAGKYPSQDNGITTSVIGESDEYSINPADIAINYAVEAVGFIPEVLAAAADGGIWIGNKINKATGSTELDFSVLDKVREAKDAVKEFAGLDDTAYNAATNGAIDNLYEVYSNDKLDTTDKLAAFSGILYDNANLVPQLTADSYQFVKQMMTGLASGNGLQAIDKIYAKLRPATEKSQSVFNKLGTKYDQMQVKADQASRLATAGKLSKIKNLQIQGTNAVLRGAGAPKTLIDTADTLDEIEKNGGDVTLGRAIATFSIKFGENKLDSFIDRATMGMSKQGKAVYSKIGEVFNKLPKTPTLGEAQSVKAGLVAVLSRTLKEAGKIGTATTTGLGIEGLTETLQEVASMYNERYDTDLFRDKEFLGMFDEEGQRQLVGAFGLGVLGAAGQTGIAQTSNITSKAIGLAGEVKDKVAPAVKTVKDTAKKAADSFNINPDTMKDAAAGMTNVAKNTADGIKSAYRGAKDAGAAYIVTRENESEQTAQGTPDVSDSDLDEASTLTLKEQSELFDASYNEALGVLNTTLQDAKNIVEEQAAAGNTVEFGPHLVPQIAGLIEQLKGEVQKAKEAGAGPARLEYMNTRLEELNALTTVNTTDEMAKIMAYDITAPSKASMVLGSSAEALLDDSGNLSTEGAKTLDALIADPNVTAAQKKLLEFKKELLTTKDTELSKVAYEKLFGSDTKLGVVNYANSMINGEFTADGLDRLRGFSQSQVEKASNYREAIEAWDAANGVDTAAMANMTDNQKAAYRSANSNKSTKDYIDIKGTDGNMHVNAAQTTLESIEKEQNLIDSLMTNTATPKTSQKGSESTQEARAPVEDTTTPVEEEKAPEASIDAKPAPRKTKDEEDFEKGAEVLYKKIEAAKNKTKKVDPDPVVEDETAGIDVAALQEEFRESSPVEKKSPEEPAKDTETTIDVVGLNAELASIQEDISYLEEAKESETLAERVITNREIAKLEKKADTLLEKLGLEGTVGDYILSNPAPKRKKSDLIKGEKEVALSDFFEVKKVYNNLVHKLFTKPFEEVQKIVGFSSDEAAYVTGGQYLTRTTASYIRKFIKNGFDQSGISDIDVTDSNKAPYQSISRLLLIGEPGNYNMPAEVVGAMSVAINDWIVGYSSLRASVRTAEDTDRIFGSKNKEDRAKVSNIDGLVTTVANSLGAKIYKELGLKAKKEDGTNREVLEAKMKLELGLMAMEAMKYNNLIEINTVKAADIFSKDSLGVDPNINVFTMTGAAKMLDNPKVSKNLSISSRYAGKLLGGGTQMRYPTTTEPLADRKVKNSSEIGKYYKTAKETEQAVNKQEQTTWEWTKEYVESYLDMVKEPEGRDKLKTLLGWKDPKEHHILLQPGINGKNQAIESDMQFLEDWYNEMQATGKEQMWFPYKLVKNGRFILDSNTFNPQGKKLHRFAVHSNVATITDKTKDNHALSLAMAFGVDIDKKTKASAIKEWEVIDNELHNLIEEGFTDLEILETAVDKGWTHDVPHTLGGIIEYRRYNEYIKKNESVKGFKSTLPIETDAVTSGFILKLLQMPILKDVKKFLAKGGVFLESDGTESFGKQAEEPGFDDAYNTPAKVMKEAMKPVTTKLRESVSITHINAITRASELALGVGVGEAITDIKRKFMKSPFMTFNYGAGISTIITSIGDDAIESLYTKLTSDNKKDVAQAINIIANSRVGMEYKDGAWVASNKVSPLEDLRTMSKAARLTYILPKAIEDNIRGNISASVGVALEETFNKEYAPFIEAANTINKSFVVMFRLFKHKVDKEINTKQDTLGRYLTTDEITEVYTKHAKSMPAIRTALGTEASKMMIFGTQATNYTPTDKIKESGQGKVRLAGKDNYLSGQAKFYEMVEADKAGAVIPIHYIDGSIQSIVLNEFDVLGVHDANMFYADNVIEGTRKYNEGTARTATEYSLTEEILTSINETIANSDKEAVDAVDVSLKEEFKGDKDLAPSVQIVQQDMQVLKDKSTKGREEIFSNDIRFEHAAYEGSHYDMKGKPAIIAEPNISTDISQAALDKATAILDKEEANCKK